MDSFLEDDMISKYTQVHLRDDAVLLLGEVSDGAAESRCLTVEGGRLRTGRERDDGGCQPGVLLARFVWTRTRTPLKEPRSWIISHDWFVRRRTTLAALNAVGFSPTSSENAAECPW